MASATRPFRFQSICFLVEFLPAERIAAVIAALQPQLHQDFKADSKEAVWQRVASNDFREIFVAHGRGPLGIGHRDEQPHADGVGGHAGMEIDARAGDADTAADVIEWVAFRVRRPDAHQLRDFAAPAAAAFRLLGARGGDAAWVVDFGHLVVRGRHGRSAFRG